MVISNVYCQRFKEAREKLEKEKSGKRPDSPPRPPD
jgi:hypothetical protein